MLKMFKYKFQAK